MTRTLSLILRNVVFTVVVPGAGGVYVPWLILTRHGDLPAPAAWYATPVIAIGVALYLWCVWLFAAIGRGTPGYWDAPRQFVAAGPYRWLRNPIYIAALLIVSGEAWLFLSVGLLLYALGLAVAFHLLVIGFEEPKLRARFGEQYQGYRRAVSRWIPHPGPRQSVVMSVSWADQAEGGESCTGRARARQPRCRAGRNGCT